MAKSELLWTGVPVFDDTELYSDDTCGKWNAELGGRYIAEHFAKALVIGKFISYTLPRMQGGVQWENDGANCRADCII